MHFYAYPLVLRARDSGHILGYVRSKVVLIPSVHNPTYKVESLTCSDIIPCFQPEWLPKLGHHRRPHCHGHRADLNTP